uniref:GOLD domain-containing protein n=1 Tax=Caenorhabditis japonica TaxID=281687 RepID=A0A8R1HS13_CAEJA
MLHFLLLSFLLVGGHTLTTKSQVNDDSEVGRILTFESESQLSCFYEPLEVGMVVNMGMRPAFDSVYPMQFRVTSPSGDFSDWASGDGDAHMEHNTTENGAYEICVYTRRPMKINLYIQFYSPEKMENSLKSFFDQNQISKDIQTSIMASTHRIYKIYYHLKFYNQMVVRDEALQEKNADFVQNYNIVFCTIAIIISLSQVYYVRKLFRIDPKQPVLFRTVLFRAVHSEQFYSEQFYSGQFYSGQFYSGQFYSGQFYSGQFYSGQFYSGQFYSGQFYSGQFYSGQFYSGQFYSGQFYSGKFYSEQFYSGQFYSGQFYSGQFYSGQFYSRHIAATQLPKSRHTAAKEPPNSCQIAAKEPPNSCQIAAK